VLRSELSPFNKYFEDETKLWPQICLTAGSKWSGEELTDDVLPSLLSGANVAGFIKVADAMKAQGDWW